MATGKPLYNALPTIEDDDNPMVLVQTGWEWVGRAPTATATAVALGA